jgi:hypothetical protein
MLSSFWRSSGTRAWFAPSLGNAAGQRVENRFAGEQAGDRVTNIPAYFGRCGGDFRNEGVATVDHGEEIQFEKSGFICSIPR